MSDKHELQRYDWFQWGMDDWSTGEWVRHTDAQDRIRTLEAERDQARADARVLVEWADKTVRLERGDRQPTAGRDVIEALERNKP